MPHLDNYDQDDIDDGELPEETFEQREAARLRAEAALDRADDRAGRAGARRRLPGALEGALSKPRSAEESRSMHAYTGGRFRACRWLPSTLDCARQGALEGQKIIRCSKYIQFLSGCTPKDVGALEWTARSAAAWCAWVLCAPRRFKVARKGTTALASARAVSSMPSHSPGVNWAWPADGD